MLIIKRQRAAQIVLSGIVLWLMAIAYACLAPNDDLPSLPPMPHFDKVVHFTIYFVLAHLVLVYNQIKAGSVRTSSWLMLAVFACGVLVECLQLFMGMGRSFSCADILANSLGLLSGVLFFRLLQTFYARLITRMLKD